MYRSMKFETYDKCRFFCQLYSSQTLTNARLAVRWNANGEA